MKTFRFGLGTWIFAFLILVPSFLTSGEATKQLSATIDAEQNQFVEAFTRWQLIYYGKTVRSSRGEKVQFKREVQDRKDAYVQTRIVPLRW
jgi:ABC-type transporter MlaC component